MRRGCLLPVSSAGAQGTLPAGSLPTVSEAGGQLFWVTAGAKVSLYTRPVAGGVVRRLGTVAGQTPGADQQSYTGSSAHVAFDGTNYAVALASEVEVTSSIPPDNCDGVCEPDILGQEEVIAGALNTAPKVLSNCTLNSEEDFTHPPAVAIVAGRTFFAARCGAPAGIDAVDAAGAVTSFDAAGSLPLAGTGNWLTYAAPGATKVLDLAGAGTYSVPVAYDPNASNSLQQALLLQSDGSIVLAGAFFRTGGTTPPVPIRPKFPSSLPETFIAGDRLFYGDLAQISLPAGQAAAPLVAPGLAGKRALALNGSMLDVAGYSCTGVVNLRTLDLGAAAPAGAVDGCPLAVTTGKLRLTAKRTITVAVRCVNGCTGNLTLETGNLDRSAKVRVPVGGKATVRFRVTARQVKAVARSASFFSGSPWLAVDSRTHRLR